LKLLNIYAEWTWTDVWLVGTLQPIIDMLPSIYTKADSIIALDALTFQLHADGVFDIAVSLRCGEWVTRVWT
jgi:hypothetical protein